MILGGAFSFMKIVGFPGSLIWSTLAIIVGIILKQGCDIKWAGMRGRGCKCGDGMKCENGMCEKNKTEDHVCEGADCQDCK